MTGTGGGGQNIFRLRHPQATDFDSACNACYILRWFIGDFTLTPQYFASSLSVNCHDSQFHRLPTISLHRVCQQTVTTVTFTVYRP